MDNQAEDSAKSENSDSADSGTSPRAPLINKEEFIALLKKVALRAKEVLTQPQNIWQTIKNEGQSVKDTYQNYLFVMAAVPALCGFIGTILVYGTVFSNLLGQAIFYGFMLGVPYLIAIVIEQLAPHFEGKAERNEAFNLAVYSNTPGYAVGLLALIPNATIGLVGSLLALYGIYIFLQGVPQMTTVPAKHAMKLTLAVAAIMIVIQIILWLIVMAVAIGGVMATGTV